MEGFCIDIQRIILGLISQGRSSRLSRLFRVNWMFRSWVSRFVIDTVSKSTFHGRLVEWYNNHHEVISWGVFDKLNIQWKKRPNMLASFIMFVDAISNPVHQKHMPFVSNFHVVLKMAGFEKEALILRDVKKKVAKQLELDKCQHQIIMRERRIAHNEKSIENNKIHLESNKKKREKAEAVILELDTKYKKAKK